ncbi:hypothetical protein DXG01_014441 [Tephrocybe rancida]|nr:hypothetical protein DXG01_014441 [Tephrocybe rancida]
MDLASIPPNVVVRTLQHIEDDRLYRLGLLCRRLNHLALNLILDRHYIDQHQHNSDRPGVIFASFELPKDRLIVAALYFAFSAIPISSFDCRFNKRSNVRDFSRITDILTTKMRPGLNFSISRIYLHNWSSDFLIDGDKLCASLLAHGWSRSDLSASLEVNDDKFESSTYYWSYLSAFHPTTPSPPATQYLHTLYTPLSRLLPPLQPQPRFILAGLKFTESRHFLRENLDHTIGRMRALRSLTLGPIGFKGTAWPGMLSAIASSAVDLEMLDIYAQDIFPEDLVDFLGCLRKLASLHINVGRNSHDSHHRWQSHEAAETRRITMHSLQILVAPPAYVATMLAHRLPKKPRVTILIPVDDFRIGLFSQAEMRRAFSAISSRLDSSVVHSGDVTLDFRYEPRYAAASLARDLDEYCTFGLGSKNPMASFASLSISFPQLLMETSRSNESLAFTDYFVQWLQLFPSLSYLILTGIYNENPDWIYPFIHTLHSYCPNIRYVRLSVNTINVLPYLSAGRSGGITDTSNSTSTAFGNLDKDVSDSIFQYVEINELYSLASLCRNLRNWALPAFFATTSLTAIEVVEIDFGPAGFLKDITKKHSKLKWTRLVVDILSTLAAKSSRLSIRGRGFIGDVTSSLSDPVPGTEGSALPLRDLVIDTESLKISCIRDWIEHCLVDTRITYLRLPQLSCLYVPAFLRVVAKFPLLVELTLGGANILPEDVLMGLNELKVLKSLAIDGCHHYFGERGEVVPLKLEGHRVPHLPLLRFLSTTAEYAAFLLGPEGAGLPKLEVLTIHFYSTPACSLFDPRNITQSMTTTVEHLQLRPNFVKLRLLHFGIENILIYSLEMMTTEGWEVTAQFTKEIVIQNWPISGYFLNGDAQGLRHWLLLFPSLRCLILEANTDLVLRALKAGTEGCPLLSSIWVDGSLWRRHHGHTPADEATYIEVLGSVFMHDPSAGPSPEYHDHIPTREATSEAWQTLQVDP